MDSVPASKLLTTVVEAVGALLEHAQSVDVYRGAGLDDGTLFLTFALRFRGDDRTRIAADATEAKHTAVAFAVLR